MKDIHPVVWLWFPPLMWVAMLALYFFAPQFMEKMLALDHHGGGWVEQATVIALMPGIIVGALTVFYHRASLPNPWVVLWLVCWTLGALYFALEEISWGQWFFGWDSPEIFVEHNEQQETNLHNMSAWLNRRPRVLLEWWILLVGLIMPIWAIARRRDPAPPQTWRHWIFPTHVVLCTTVLYFIVRVARWLDNPTFGNTEFREYYIAVFISVYLLSCWSRARTTRPSV